VCTERGGMGGGCRKCSAQGSNYKGKRQGGDEKGFWRKIREKDALGQMSGVPEGREGQQKRINSRQASGGSD